ncbi:hypothetical protein DFH09DRAFT_1452445 [Mycena vulgaris]|nr:hypothetical protein DFH09DRAFT_1452445 [Mycena vulgaris]
MFASFKKAVAKRTKKKSKAPPFDWDAYMIRHQHDDFPDAPWPMYDPATWPSKWHHKCDLEWCGFANTPRTVPGNFECSHPDCNGLYTVTPEMAAAVAVHNRKNHCRKVLHSLTNTDDTILRSSGKSAMEARTRPRAPSFSSVVTAPVRVLQEPGYQNSIWPEATTSRRPPRYAQPASSPVCFPQQQGSPSYPSPNAFSLASSTPYKKAAAARVAPGLLSLQRIPIGFE